MNTKKLIPVVGVLLLSSSVAALADEHRGGHPNGAPAFHASNHRDGFRQEGFRMHGRTGVSTVIRSTCLPSAGAHPRRAPVGSGAAAAPVLPSHWSQGPTYNRDGVTIIFRGHLN